MGYHLSINYEAVGLPLEVMFVITAPPDDRTSAVEKILEIRGIVDVRETLTGQRNFWLRRLGQAHLT